MGSVNLMDTIKEPMFCDEPFTQTLDLTKAIPAPVKCCLWAVNCCFMVLLKYVMSPKVRGIPRSSVPLSDRETKEMLAKLQGKWVIQPLDGISGGAFASAVTYTDVFVRGDSYTVTGGFHRTKHGSAPNPPQQNTFHMYRGPNKEIYIDFIGSMLTNMNFAGGEITLDNAMGIKALWQRKWKADGLPGPQGREEYEEMPQMKTRGIKKTEDPDAADDSALALGGQGLSVPMHPIDIWHRCCCQHQYDEYEEEDEEESEQEY
eukprot:gnl/TRDRNA2_/TRDRNA2_158915_c2_seq3.p1 gnl/TRDRNA2_/TRDRNA2_158915_c2~~gnl/TRDRNA2_/TRDRNA2_158915_c2_seq3.p1  ORF type:complete len:261 (-),score=49.99 gnl/TRDRNA2_/TRDRNA2_158915_c2_seq3:302-1084(-)